MNRERKFSQSVRSPPGYHPPRDLVGELRSPPGYPPPRDRGGESLRSPLGYHNTRDVVGVSDSTPQQLPQLPPRGSGNQQRDQPGGPEPSAQFPETIPLYSISKSVIQRVKNYWVELGKKGCGIYRSSSEKSLGRDRGLSNESTQSSLRTDSVNIGQPVSLDDRSKDNNDIWNERLEDYKFLSGDPSTEKKHTSIFSRQKSSNQYTRRHSIAEWRIWPRNNDEANKCRVCKQVVHKSCISKVDKCQGCEYTAPVHNDRGGPQVIPDPRFAPPVTQPTQDISITNSYWNLQLTEYPWWVETMTRLDSTSLLTSLADGTFLLRWSENHHQPILSLKSMGEVKHMKINRQEDAGYFLSEAHLFNSIVDLINYHYTNSLSESFQGLDQTLIRPVYDLGRVSFTYTPPANSKNHLSMLQGEKIVVISHDGEARGWWKGRIGTRVGYFPREYVTLDN